MAKKNLRAVPVTSTVLGCIEDGYQRLEELQGECQEIVDNASENLQQTQRIQTLSETADALYSSDSVPDVPEFLQDVPVTHIEDQRKSRSTSRATRCSEACTVLYAAIAGIDHWIETKEHEDDSYDSQVEEAEYLKDSVQELIDSVEGCEFPGMYG